MCGYGHTKSSEAYWVIFVTGVASIKAVRPTESGTYKSGESYRKWNLSKRLWRKSQPFHFKEFL